MSLQWTLIAGFLYLELAIIFIMLLSIIKPQLWRSLFQSNFAQSLSRQSNLYLYAFIGILCLFFLESIREFHKYSGKVRHDDRIYPGSASFYEDQMRLFRAQRNFYISGFSLFGLFIIKRLTSLISQQAMLKANAEASRRQAENLTEHLKNLEAVDSSKSELKFSNAGDTPGSTASSGDADKILAEMKDCIAELEEKNRFLSIDLTAMKTQAEATNAEFDRLTELYAELQNKYDRAQQ